jgi:caa(3)-type oxidase subunit IV
MGGTLNIVVALIIACVKASLVGAYFMHLISEKQLIYSVLYLCAAFIVFMFGLILFHNANGIVL